MIFQNKKEAAQQWAAFFMDLFLPKVVQDLRH